MEFEKIEAIYNALSGGNSFLDPDTIRFRQVLDRAREIAGETRIDDARRDVLRNDPDQWNNLTRVQLTLPVTSEVKSAFKNLRERKYSRYRSAHQEWSAEKNLSSHERYRKERQRFYEVIRQHWTLFSELCFCNTPKKPQKPVCEYVSAPEERSSVDLVIKIKQAFANQVSTNQAALKKTWEFLISDELDSSPFVRTSCLLYASLARRAALGQKPHKSHPLVDVEMLAAYLPFCDAMFVDKPMHNLLDEEPLRSELETTTRVFSLRNKGDFLKYLDNILREIPSTQWETLRQIYPEDWLAPVALSRSAEA